MGVLIYWQYCYKHETSMNDDNNNNNNNTIMNDDEV